MAVAYRLLSDAALPGRTRDELLIVNAGAPAPGLSHELATFFKVALGPLGFPKTAYVPLTGYYCSAQVTAELAVGPPFSYGSCDQAEPNATRAFRLGRGFADLAERNGLAGSAEVLRFAKVSYLDGLGDLRSDYFLAWPQAACHLPEQDGRLVFEFHDHLVRSLALPPFADLTPRDLYDRWTLIANDERNRSIDQLRCAAEPRPRTGG
jgi:hypothetical protein